ncbi:hypothetical protein H1C71_019241, partial [Ictidomys tridecemlineatus]
PPPKKIPNSHGSVSLCLMGSQKAHGGVGQRFHRWPHRTRGRGCVDGPLGQVVCRSPWYLVLAAGDTPLLALPLTFSTPQPQKLGTEWEFQDSGRAHIFLWVGKVRISIKESRGN